MSLCTLGARADSTPDPCSPTTACTATCTSSPCQVSLTRNGSSLSLTYNGTDASILCAADYSTVKWAAQTALPSLIGAFFSASHYPGSTNIVTGSSTVAASTNVSAPNQAQSCYVYSVMVCDSTGSCAKVDPRVIVTGVHPKAKKKKKEY